MLIIIIEFKIIENFTIGKVIIDNLWKITDFVDYYECNDNSGSS